MKIKRILITGDDGYNSIGTRLLVHFLKDKYELAIAGTKTQQSGVGGILHLRQKVRWEEIKVHGVSGVCVHGSPCDAIEFALGYFKEPFDLIISGLNLGANLGPSIISSGTVAAAIMGLAIDLAPRGLILSWNMDYHYFFMNHKMSHSLEKYLEYPGKVTADLIEEAIKKNLWRSRLVNINFPRNPSTKVKFTKLAKSSNWFYKHPVVVDYKKKTFSYPIGFVPKRVATDYDVGAIKKGYISISPMRLW
ncbi:hypothetical protein A3C28_03005 [Candidatus Roizmanbacteria bacterium RIFCSPHIGHO2_02_FULL_39_9]|uniref:5'-nucleotidase n=2 Tax=Candidatus Roizmaniibacteriota TaxID=1752723 RepID=A0A1F7HVR4_9BACT|nr:MAG: hypothetical protein A3C28_03005 [Candidatus Roizmanbacteria bacterium RIFCSPHIGHO2_02_FULL_39_9]OGK35205.1 MAG: hypothetical protein A3F60_03785 [Candidatus Roizmanbacteria bacterium RIFCSPHIGHO2_12_FULL_39_8]